MSLRNGDRSRKHSKDRFKAKLRAKRRLLLDRVKEPEKVISISDRKAATREK
jgi:hypothetical protein